MINEEDDNKIKSEIESVSILQLPDLNCFDEQNAKRIKLASIKTEEADIDSFGVVNKENNDQASSDMNFNVIQNLNWDQLAMNMNLNMSQQTNVQNFAFVPGSNEFHYPGYQCQRTGNDILNSSINPHQSHQNNASDTSALHMLAAVVLALENQNNSN